MPLPLELGKNVSMEVVNLGARQGRFRQKGQLPVELGRWRLIGKSDAIHAYFFKARVQWTDFPKDGTTAWSFERDRLAGARRQRKEVRAPIYGRRVAPFWIEGSHPFPVRNNFQAIVGAGEESWHRYRQQPSGQSPHRIGKANAGDRPQRWGTSRQRIEEFAPSRLRIPSLFQAF